jgi:hypothetical protein
VNPNADTVEGDPGYHDLKSVPGTIDWVLIGTKPKTAEATMRECADLGIKRVWMHRGPGAGSVSHSAAEYGRRHGITVIEGGCPCMFDPTADPGHKVMRFQPMPVTGGACDVGGGDVGGVPVEAAAGASACSHSSAGQHRRRADAQLATTWLVDALLLWLHPPGTAEALGISLIICAVFAAVMLASALPKRDAGRSPI